MWKRHRAVYGIILLGAGLCGSTVFALPTVTVVASDPAAAIGTTDPGVFIFTRTGNLTLSADAAHTVGSPNNALIIIGSSSISTTNNPPTNTNNVSTTTNGVSIGTNVVSTILDDSSLAMPKMGDNGLRILSPTLLEVRRINSKQPDPATVDAWDLDAWDLVNSSGILQALPLSQFAVTANRAAVPIQLIGFKRRPLYAPLVNYDLRIENCIYLQLATPIAKSPVAMCNFHGRRSLEKFIASPTRMI